MKREMEQLTFSAIIEDEVAAAIEIAEAEIGHDLLDSYLNASPAKQKKADAILMSIMAIHDNAEEDEDEKSLAIFAKVLTLEMVLGIA